MLKRINDFLSKVLKFVITTSDIEALVIIAFIIATIIASIFYISN